MKFRDVLIGVWLVFLTICLVVGLCVVVYSFCEWAMKSIGGF